MVDCLLMVFACVCWLLFGFRGSNLTGNVLLRQFQFRTSQARNPPQKLCLVADVLSQRLVQLLSFDPLQGFRLTQLRPPISNSVGFVLERFVVSFSCKFFLGNILWHIQEFVFLRLQGHETQWTKHADCCSFYIPDHTTMLYGDYANYNDRY